MSRIGQPVALAYLKIHLVVGGSDLERAGAEFPIHGRICDNRYGGAIQRTPHRLPDQVRVARIAGMDRDRNVARNRLRPRGGHLNVPARLAGQLVTHLVKGAIDRLHDDFLVGEGGERGRTPVHHAFSAVNPAATKKLRKGSGNGAIVVGIHREHRPIPVAGASESLELAEDDPAVLFLPGLGPLQERLAADLPAGLALAFAQFPLHDRVRRNAGMVGARNPQRGLPLQPGPAHQDVLDCVVQNVPHA